MATLFNKDIVGKPFPKNIINELNSRSNINPDTYTTSAFVKLARVKEIPTLVNNVIQPATIYTESELDYPILSTVNNNVQVSPETPLYTVQLDPFINSISIEVKDFAFYIINVTFSCDIRSFSKFKRSWLNFGAPVQLEIGKRGFAKNPDVDELPSNFQRFNGMIVKFDFNYDRSSNTVRKAITGTISIYSFNSAFVFQESKDNQEEQKEFADYLKDYSKTLAKDNTLSKNELDPYILAYVKSNYQEDVTNESALFYLFYGYGIKNIIDESNAREGRKIAEKFDVVSDDLSGVVNNRKKENTDDLYKKMFERLRRLGYDNVTINDFYTETGSRVITTFQTNKRKEIGSNEYYNINKFNTYTSLKRKFSQPVLKDLDTLHNYDFYKIILSYMKLNADEYGVGAYYFISMRTVESIINNFINQSSKNVALSSNKYTEPFLKVDLTNVKIKNMFDYGFISKYPEKVLFNPRNNTYIEDITPPKTQNVYDTSEFKLDENNGIYNILGDVYISITELYAIAENTNSIYSFCENVVELINRCSGGILNLVKRNNTAIETSQYLITDTVFSYMDIQSINVNANDISDYYMFDLLDAKSPAINFSVKTEISGDIADYVFYNTNKSINLKNNVFFQKPTNERTEFVTSESTDSSEQSSSLNNSNLRIGLFDIKIEDINSRLSKIAEYTSNFENIVERNLFDVIEPIVDSKLDKDEKYQISVFYTYLQEYIKLKIDLVNLDILSPTTSLQKNIILPLNVSIDVQGIANVMTGHVFKLETNALPVYVDSENTNYCFFIVSGLTHDISYSQMNRAKWITKITGSMFVDSTVNASVLQTTQQSDEALKILRNRRLERFNSLETKLKEVLRKRN